MLGIVILTMIVVIIPVVAVRLVVAVMSRSYSLTAPALLLESHACYWCDTHGNT